VARFQLGLMQINNQTLLPEKYAVIPRVLIFPMRVDGRVLLLQGFPFKKIWPNLWNGLGGHVERNETVLEAARRELKEESGLEAQSFTLVGQIQVDTGTNPGVSMFVFLAEGFSGEFKPSEEGELAWKTLDEALELPLVEDLYTLLPLLSNQEAKDHPFWGAYRYDKANQLVIDLEFGSRASK
jgi:8-oxo-dGTP diphosphatase